MEVRIGIAKTSKYAMQYCGDSCDIAERPHGGISAIIADGQGNGLAAHHTSSLVVNKAASLLADGTRDGAVARAVHDYLYAVKDRKVSCTLALVSADLESETVVISRNTNCPAIVKTDEYTAVYDESVSAIGVNRHMKPIVYELPMTPGMVIVTYTDGIAHAGKKRKGEEASIDKIIEIIEKNDASDPEFIARSIMEYALTLDQEQAGDDMTIVVLSVVERQRAGVKIEEIRVTYPC
ncbi:SpoIIE family protein phosphatase [Selenomonas sp. TAMA-11512]|uniref:PP2C family protein-serine/threonine phosphatase n=1 Tax=Selenomonas sp. TAMA-11512 TaxID=3095337 RepID=UPI0030864B9C|nr:SpoIIE family protein phosphatase [Selenomonas sp. TAMA-11512]